MSDWIMVFFGVFLTAGTAIFVASEFSLVTIDPAVLKDEPETPSRRDKSVRYALKHLSTELSSAQVGITVTTILLGFTAQPAITNLLSNWLSQNWLSNSLATGLSVVVSLVLVNLFSMLFGELIPKNFALSLPLPTARLMVPMQRIFTSVFGALIKLLNNSANAILRTMGVEPKEELSGSRSASEFVALVQRSAQLGTLDETTAVLITNAAELDELNAHDVMTDRMRLSVVTLADSCAEVMNLARRTGHSRFPVIGESKDDIIGLVHVRDVMAIAYDERATTSVVEIMTTVLQVPETLVLGALLQELKVAPLQLAIVGDEYGGTCGLVTLEDVVEELIGDVSDEHDPSRAGALRAVDGSWILPGLLRPDEVFEQTGIQLPQNHTYDTLGGLVMTKLGRIAAVGDELNIIGHDNEDNEVLVHLVVEVVAGMRVDRVRLGQGQS